MVRRSVCERSGVAIHRCAAEEGLAADRRGEVSVRRCQTRHPLGSGAHYEQRFGRLCSLLGILISCGGNVTEGGTGDGHGGVGGSGRTATAGHSAISGGGFGGAQTQCTTDAECPRVGVCRMCPDGSTLCPSSRCDGGQCVGTTGTCGPTAGMGGAGMGGAPECTSARDCHIVGVCLTCSDGTVTCAKSDCAEGRCVVLFKPCPSGDGGAAGDRGNRRLRIAGAR